MNSFASPSGANATALPKSTSAEILEKESGTLLSLSLFRPVVFGIAVSTLILANCAKPPAAESPSVYRAPVIETINVPVAVAGTPNVISVPEILIIDRGIGIQSMPMDIEKASSRVQELGKAVAKVMRANGASGSGFFISANGLFLTNEHVIPRSACTQDGCPGVKIVLGFRKGGMPRVFSKFQVIAQDFGNKEFDFTLVKVELGAGEVVPFLDLETDESAYRFDSKSESGRYVALGHPGGATLQFANAKPLETRGFNILFQGLIIGGNSGGPLVDSKTGKVVGLDKETRDSFVRVSAGIGATDKKNMATSVRSLLRVLKTEAPREISNVRGLDLIDGAASASGQFAPARSLPRPPIDVFAGVLRRSISDARLPSALAAFDLYIGTFQESAVLDLMLRRDDTSPGEIVVDALAELLRKQLKVGRSLNFSQPAQQVISDVLELHPGDEISAKMTAAIMMNYFDEDVRRGLQKKCIEAFPAMPALAAGILYTCVSIEGRSGVSLIEQAAKTLRLGNYRNVDDFGVVTGFLMFAGTVGTKDEKELKAIADLEELVTEKNADIPSYLQNNSFAMDIIKGVAGVGSFGEAYPK